MACRNIAIGLLITAQENIGKLNLLNSFSFNMRLHRDSGRYAALTREPRR